MNKFKHIGLALTYTRYRQFFFWQSFSYVGTWMQQTAMIWLIYRLTNSSVMLGLMGFLSQIPSLFLSPYAGVLTDRYDRRRLLLITQFAYIVIGLFFAIMVLTNHVQSWILLLLAVCFGLVNSFDMPSRQAYFVDLIDDRKALANAIALNSVMFHASRLIGPAIAGFVIKFSGEGLCFLYNALSYIPVFILLLTFAPRPSLLKHTGSKRSFFWEGLQYVRQRPQLLAYIQLVFSVSFFGMAYMILSPVIVRTVFQGDSVLLGYFMSLAGLGAMFGALYIASHHEAKGLAPRIYVASIVLGIALATFALSTILWVSMLVMPLIGFTMMMQLGGSNVTLQSLTDDRYRGRVISLYAMAFAGTVPLGNLVTGLSAHFIGAPITLALCGLACLLAGQIFQRRMS
jgi:MFS family permease